MKVVDLHRHHTGRIRQAAALLHDGFREHWPDAWPSKADALGEVESLFGEDRRAGTVTR